jgi:hypothetical protein
MWKGKDARGVGSTRRGHQRAAFRDDGTMRSSPEEGEQEGVCFSNDDMDGLLDDLDGT